MKAEPRYGYHYPESLNLLDDIELGRNKGATRRFVQTFLARYNRLHKKNEAHKQTIRTMQAAIDRKNRELAHLRDCSPRAHSPALSVENVCGEHTEYPVQWLSPPPVTGEPSELSKKFVHHKHPYNVFQ